MRRALVSCLAVLLPVVANPQGGPAGPRNPPRKMQRTEMRLDPASRLLLDDEVDVFIRLEAASVAEFCLRELARGNPSPTRAMQARHAELLRGDQARIESRLAALGAGAVARLRVGANGIRARARRRDIPEIRKISGVVSVAPIDRHRPSNETSVPWIGAPEVWEAFGTGEGIRIAVIDSGIDYLHANFGGSGDPRDYAGNDPALIEPGTFPTAKVIGGFDFAGTSYDASGVVGPTTPSPDPDPLDGEGHGSHVAGSAAGLGVPGTIGPGVAPGALLYALKVFGDVAGTTTLTADAIEWALDPNGDGSTDDRVDVINMSLGAPFGSPDDPSSIAAQNATELGVMVVAASGNEGDVPYITSSPGVAPDAISVAASVDGGMGVPAVSVNTSSAAGLYPMQEGLIGPPLALVGPITANLAVGEPLDGCNPLQDMAGRIALVQRGGCVFSIKHQNALAAGAVGIIVYNNAGDDLLAMSGDPVPIPGVFIGQSDGETIREAAESETVNVTLDDDFEIPMPGLADTLASFSARGPGHGGTRFKPDVSAPGRSIRSTGVGLGEGAAVFSGTSMATPHVAGLAALLRQLHPDRTPPEIKALIQNATVTANSGGIGSDTPYPLARQGTGIVRANLAASLQSYARPGGVSFGRINPILTRTVLQRVTIQNLSNSFRLYRVQHVPNQTFPGITVGGPNWVFVPPQGSRNVILWLRMDPSMGPFDDGFFSQTEVDGWFVFDNFHEQLRVGYLAAVDPASHVIARSTAIDEVALRNLGPSLGWAEGFTLSRLGRGLLPRAPNGFEALGFRTNHIAGFDVMELGIALARPWESMSNLEVQVLVDVDGDAAPDVLLLALDFSAFGGPIGDIVTIQIDLATNDAFADWSVISDFNDNTAVLPFTRAASGGLVPDVFDYVAIAIGRDGTADTLRGRIDLAAEIVPELNSFGLEAGESVSLATTGDPRRMLWLFQNNIPARQAAIVRVR